MYDYEVAGGVRAVREQLRISNKLKLAQWLEEHDFLEDAEGIFRECAHDLGVVLNGQ